MTPDKQAPHPKIYENGKLNAQRGFELYGLSRRDLEQPLEYKGHKGTMGEFFDGCPLGQTVADAYTNGGIEGVRRTFKGMKDLFGPDLNLEVSPETLETHRRLQEKKR